MKKVLIINAFYPHYEVEREVLSKFSAEVLHVETDDVENIIEEARHVDAIMTRETVLPRSFISKLEQCKVIVRYGVGVDNIDLEAAKEHQIFVANVPEYGSDTVAEHALALLLSVGRRIVTRDHAVRNGAWGIGIAEPMYSFVDKTLGIVGFGNIGKAFYKKAKALGFKEFLVYDPYCEDFEGCKSVELDELFTQSDAISLHMPLNAATQHVINKDLLSKMKNTAILVNTSRGGLINEDDLVEVLKNKNIFGAGIDVYDQEPPQRNHPFFELDNVIVTDHTGWYSKEALENLQRKAAIQVKLVFEDKQPTSWVNRW
jgi:D-3-phosphoglycerate dehydrogenase